MVANMTSRKSSPDVPVETRSRPPLGLTDEGHPPLVAVAPDIRDRLVAEELLRLQAEQFAVANDRVGDVHDIVIQRIFIAGLALDATIRLGDEPRLAERLGFGVDKLDAVIRELRGATFGLTHVDQRSGNRRSDELGGEDG